MMNTATFLLQLALAGLPTLAAGTAWAETYPSRPIKVIVPLAPGSTADIMARTINAELAKELGQTLVVDNKAGAGGSIAMAELARAEPDGYTLAFASQGNMVFNLSLYAKPGYDSLKDFAPIALVGGVSNVMIVPNSSTAKNVADVVAQAKASPGGLTYSSGGIGTSHHLSGALFQQQTGTNVLHVPYKGAPQGILAVMSGEVSMGFYNTPTVLTQIKGGKVKALAVTSTARSPLLADIPTMNASGIKGYEVNTWFGFVAPSGLPPEVLSRLSAAVAKVLAMPAIQKVFSEQGVDVARDTSPAALTRLLRDDLAKWPAIIKASGAKAD